MNLSDLMKAFVALQKNVEIINNKLTKAEIKIEALQKIINESSSDQMKINYENFMHDNGQRPCDGTWDYKLGKCLPKINTAPVAKAGEDKTVVGGDLVTLSGEAIDAESNIKKMTWTQVSGDAIEITPTSDGSTIKFTAPNKLQTFEFKFTVQDSNGLIGEDYVIVNVNPKIENVDKNGVKIFEGFEYTGVEEYNPVLNFQGDSKRFDSEKIRMDSVIYGGYFKVNGEDEYSGKDGGGSHNDQNPKNARCYDKGIKFDFSSVRIRTEEIHPEYVEIFKKDISGLGLESGVGRFVGIAFGKINEKDGVRQLAWIDASGLDAEGKPINNWIKVLDQLVTDPIWYAPYDLNDFQNTIRIDGQDDSFEYKYVFFREVKGFNEIPKLTVDAGESITYSTSTLPYNFNLNGTVSGTTVPFTVSWTSDNGVTINEPDNINTTASVESEGSFQITFSASTGTETASDTISLNLKVEEPNPEPSGDVITLTKDGQEVKFKLTGKKTAMERGSDHRNGQRYNVNHFFENYIMLGKFKTGKGQEQIEMKTDGPNHGGCTQLNNCMWYEPAIYMNGKVKFGTEHPHPTNHAIDLNVIQYHKDLGYSIDQSTIQYVVGAFYDKDGKRNIIQAATKDLQGIPEINIWAVENGQIFPAKYLPRDLKKIMQENDEGGLEAEIRMHQATNGDTDMQDCFVYEIEPLT